MAKSHPIPRTKEGLTAALQAALTDPKARTAFRRMVKEAHVELCGAALLQAPIPARWRTLGSLLSEFCRDGNESMTALMLRCGMVPDYCDTFGMAPVHLAAGRGHLGCLKLLVKHKAKLDVRDHLMGDTPLHLATRNHQPAAVAFLKARRVETDVVNDRREAARS